MKNNHKRIKAVIFDFDGVIVDSYEATIHYMQKTLRYFHKKEPEEKDFQGLLGFKTKDILKNLLPGIEEKELEKIYEYSKKQSIKAVKDIKLINKSDKVIKDLAVGYLLAVVSNRGRKTLDLLLSKYKLTQYFKVIISREDVKKHKPNPAPILKALKKLNVKPAGTVYIGDFDEDILAGKAAKVITILTGQSVTRTKPDYRIDNINELPKLLNEIC